MGNFKWFSPAIPAAIGVGLMGQKQATWSVILYVVAGVALAGEIVWYLAHRGGHNGSMRDQLGEGPPSLFTLRGTTDKATFRRNRGGRILDAEGHIGELNAEDNEQTGQLEDPPPVDSKADERGTNEAGA